MWIFATAPWRRAPLLLVRRPTVMAAIGGTCVLLAVAAASGPLFLSSVGAAALKRAVSAQCPEADVPYVRRSDPQSARDIRRADREVTAAMSAAGLPAPYRVTIARPTASLGTGARLQPVIVYARAGATDHVQRLRATGRPGLWISDREAGRQAVDLGDQVRIGSIRVPVAAVYEDLAGAGFGGELSPYWCSWSSLILPSLEYRPPPFLLADRITMDRIATELAATDTLIDNMAQPTWYSSVAVDQLTTIEAGEVLTRRDRLARSLRSVDPASGEPGYLVGAKLDEDLRSAGTTRDGVAGAITPVALAGVLVAVLLVGAAASFWVDQRRGEIRLLGARGVGPAALAAKACLEMAVPASLGTGIGWAAGIGLIRLLGPADRLEPDAPWWALAAVAPALAAGLAAVATVAGLRSSGQVETSRHHRGRWWWRVPWEVVLVILGAGAFVVLRRAGAVLIDSRGGISVNPMLVAFPLVAMTGVVVLLARGTTGQLPRLRGWTSRAPASLYLAARRLAGLRSATAAVLVATAVPVGILVYAASVTRSMDATVTAKSATYAGTEHALVLNARPAQTVPVDGAGTQVSVITGVDTGGSAEAEVLGIDLDTFTRFAYADPDVLGFRLPELVDTLRAPIGPGQIPAIAIRCPSCGPRTQLSLGRSQLTAAVVATADLFPGIRVRDAPVVVVPRTVLAGIDPYADRREEIWTSTAQLPAALKTLERAGQQPQREVTPEKFLSVTQLLPVAWTFGYLQALAALTGLIATAGLFLYLSARQRSALVAYVLLCRIGISRRAHLASLGAELGGLLITGWALGAAASVAAVLTVYRLIDLNPRYPPGAQLVIPLSLLTVTVIVLLGVALLGSLNAQRTADAAEPAAVLRGGE